MNPSRVVTTFFAADALCEMLNSTGIGQVVNYDDPVKVRIGSALIKVSLFIPINWATRGGAPIIETNN